MNSSAKKILWFVPKWPFPVDDGARQATTQLLKSLTAQGAQIELCAIVPETQYAEFLRQENQAIEKLGLHSVHLMIRKPSTVTEHLKNILLRPWIALTLAPYAAKYVAQQSDELLRKYPDHTLVFDGLHAAAWIFQSKYMLRRDSIYRAHNVERDLWVRAAAETRNPLKKIFLTLQSFAMTRFEWALVKLTKVTFPVSQTDTAIFKKFIPQSQVIPIPISMEIFPSRSRPPTRKHFLFVGKMDWTPNKEGLKWFLDEVWPRVSAQDSEIQLDIVGSGNSKWLESYKKLDRVNVLGRVESLDSYYDKCIATLVPIFFGSGTRVKAIESSLRGRVCIGTELGVEGIGLEEGISYLRAEKADQWVSTLLSISPEKALEMGQTARRVVEKEYNPAKTAAKFLNSF